jgi:hypothetical protein
LISSNIVFTSQITVTAAHHQKMNGLSQGRHERCHRNWRDNPATHPFSCMTSASDVDGVLAEHAQLKRSLEGRRTDGAIQASKHAVQGRVITPVAFYEKPPTLGEIAQYECAYFKLETKSFMQDKLEKEGGQWSIVIEVTAITGDPDLIISCTNKYPTDKDYTWRSMGGGDDKIVIPPCDPHYPWDGHGHWQTLFIAVPSVSAAACRFHLHASVMKWTDVEAEKRRKVASMNMQVHPFAVRRSSFLFRRFHFDTVPLPDPPPSQTAVSSSVLASTERRDKASKGRSYQEFLIDSAAPNSSSTFSLDKESSVGARRAKFASRAKDLALDRMTVCTDDPSSFTQRAMVRTAAHGQVLYAHPTQVATFESLTPNVVKRHEELKKVYSYHDPEVKVNIPDPSLANLGKGTCDADSSKEGEDAVKAIFRTTLLKPESNSSTSRPQKGREDDEAASKSDMRSIPNELLSGDRMPDIQWLFRRPSTPYTGLMQKVLESGHGTKNTMRRMLEAFQSADAGKAASSAEHTQEETAAQKPFKIVTFRGLPLPPPPQSRANLKRLLNIIQSDWDLRRKGGLIKGEEGMVPVVPIPHRPSIHLKQRDRMALAEAAALGNLKATLASLGLAMSSQGALIRAGGDTNFADENDNDDANSDASSSKKGKAKKKDPASTLKQTVDSTDFGNSKKAAENEQFPSAKSISSDSSLLVSSELPLPLRACSGKGLFKTMGRRPNSDFACVTRPKSALASLGIDHKDVQKLPHHVKSGAMPPRAQSRPEEESAIYWQSKCM